MLFQEIISAIAFAFLVGLGCVSNYLTHHISIQVLTEDHELSNSNSFIASRSYKDLQQLTSFGPRATGSDANEILTVNFLLQRVNEIKNAYANVSEISIDNQLVTGVQYVSANYRNIQNVVVKFHGKSEKAVMINCHFDSEAGSFGAGDDGVNCCTMLEILRVVAKNGEKNEFSIIFLFNGNEEGNLEGIQASHGFITQHKWSTDVKAFINLEAQGIGGREILFRSGPKHDWLVKKYRQSVKYPFGQVAAEEMFETNVLKSGTDFESFRDAGNVPGLDISYCHGGWKYHTKFDHIRYVTLDSIQHTGDNILELVKTMANSEEIENPPEGTSAVYFDMWGLFFVSYSAATGSVINIVISIVAVIFPFLIQTNLSLKNFPSVLTETFVSFVTFTLSCVLSLSACFAMGLIMNKSDNAMFWFNTTILSLGVYCSLAIIVQIAVYHISSIGLNFFTRKSKKSSRNDDDDKFDRRRKIQAKVNGVTLFWAVLTILITSFGLRLAYIIMLMLLISLITNLAIFILEKFLPSMRLHSWILLHFIGHTFSFLWTSYLLFALWKIFIPITEKTYNANPETTISLLCALMAIMTLSYFIPLTTLVKSRAILYTTLAATFTIHVILAFTSVGFPYNGSIVEPRAQRHYLTHTKRTFYDVDGVVQFTDAGFFIKENERNSKRTLDLILDSEKLLPKDDDILCQAHAFCGFPSYNTSNAFWMAAINPPLHEKSSLTLTSRSEEENSIKLSFNLVGRLLNLVYLAAEPGVTITDTSVGFSQYEWVQGRIAYFLKITNGKASLEPFSFTIAVEKPSVSVSTLFRLTVVTIDSHLDRSPRTEEFDRLIDKFPDYTFVQSHQADVSSYEFK